MAADGKTIALIGVAGVGGFVVYQYFQYSSALNTINQRDPSQQTSAMVQSLLPFTSYLGAVFGAPSPGTPQGNAYQLIQFALAGQLSTLMPATQTPTPGTTTSGQATQTSVTTAPPSTIPSAPALPAGTPQPTAQDLTNTLQTNTASADQWNFAYRELTGYGIEQLFGGNFDAIYGTVNANGQRPVGNITAAAFLNLAQAKGGMHGLGRIGAIANFYTPVLNPMSSLVFRAQHPSPYRLPMGSGLGALTQTTGMEKALWSGGWIRSRRTR